MKNDRNDALVMRGSLRDYQQEMLDRLQQAWLRVRSVMVQMPSGTGKTFLMASAIRSEKRNNEKILIVAHRRELIGQIHETLKRFGIDGERDGVYVESIQRLSCGTVDGRCRMHEAEIEPGLVMVDEAHHALAKTYRMLWDRWPRAKFLGLTATPYRLSGEPFTDLFDVLIQSADIQWFIDHGFLSDFEYVSASPDSIAVKRIAALKKRGVDGDYQTKEMATVLDTAESVAHLYETYRHFCDGKKGIVYAINREHAKHIVEYYRKQGVGCAVIDSKTPTEIRNRMVEEYRQGLVGSQSSLQVLVNVDIFGEGFDVPEVEFIQLARPTQSLSKYLQQVGRGMRVSEGKEMVTVLDNAGLYLTFGFPTDSHDWRGMFLGMKTKTGRMQDTIGDSFCQGRAGMGTDRELVNLQMVRIKHYGERKSGLEVFEENGKYGVKYDGQVTSIAKFDKIEPLRDSEFFAVATYRPARYRYLSLKTIIDYYGSDLHSDIVTEGALEDMGNGFFMVQENSAIIYWDVKTGRSYGYLPNITKIGNIEGLYVGNDCYALRYRHDKREGDFIFRKEEVYYNRYLTIIKDRLIVNRCPNVAYRIYGYRKKQIVIVRSEKLREYQLVSLDGTFGKKIYNPGATCIQFVSPGTMLHI